MPTRNGHPFLNHRFYQDILESLEDYGVLTTDMHGKVTSWNKGAENIFGYLEEEVLGLSAEIIFTPEDCKNGIPEHEFFEAQEKGRGMDERYHQKKDGTLFWASGLIFQLFDQNKAQIGFTKILRNLSHRKHAEEEIEKARQYAQGIVETSKEPIVILEPNLSITTASFSFYQLFSLDKTDARQGHFFELLSDRLDVSILQSMMQKEDSFEKLELRVLSRESFEEQIVLVSCRKIFVTHKAIGQFLLTFEDVTEARKRESAKDTFISIASHELKTPITSLTVSLQLLEKLTAEKHEFKALHFLAAKASSKVAKVTSLVKDLLDVTKIQSSNLSLMITSFQVYDLVRECKEEIENTSKSHLIEIEGDDAITIQADRNRIGQVVINFLNNAIKYSPKQQLITIVINELDAEIKVSIRDFGVGIPKEKTPFVFDRFFRVEATSQDFAGLGLGLYISSEIIKQHHGEIGVESSLGEGATFWFTLPLNQS